MGKLYSIAIIKKVDLRESKLLQIFGETDYGSIYVGPYNLLLHKNSHSVDTIFSYSLKTYKTISGAQKFINLWINNFNSKFIKINRGAVIDNRWSYNFIFNSNEDSLVIVDITDKWNSMVDKDISNIKSRLEKKIFALTKKRI